MNKKTHTSLVSFSHLLKWLINQAHSKLLKRNPKAKGNLGQFYFQLRNRATNDHTGRILKIVPSFHGKSREGFQMFNFRFQPLQIPNKTWNFRMFCTEAMFSKQNPQNLHLNASGAQSQTLHPCGASRGRPFLRNFFFFFLIMPEKVTGVLGIHQLTKNVSTVPKRKGTVVECVPFSLV